MDMAASQLIKLYMPTQVLIGSIFYAPTPEARLLDALNGAADRGSMKKEGSRINGCHHPACRREKRATKDLLY